jgi:hypothetical protein
VWCHVSSDRGFGLLLCDLTIEQNIEALHAAFTAGRSVSLYSNLQ